MSILWGGTGGGGGGGGTSIGGAITGGTDNAILFIDPAGILAQDPTLFSYNTATKQMFLGTSTSLGSTRLNIVPSAATTEGITFRMPASGYTGSFVEYQNNTGTVIGFVRGGGIAASSNQLQYMIGTPSTELDATFAAFGTSTFGISDPLLAVSFAETRGAGDGGAFYGIHNFAGANEPDLQVIGAFGAAGMNGGTISSGYLLSARTQGAWFPTAPFQTRLHSGGVGVGFTLTNTGRWVNGDIAAEPAEGIVNLDPDRSVGEVCVVLSPGVIDSINMLYCNNGAGVLQFFIDSQAVPNFSAGTLTSHTMMRFSNRGIDEPGGDLNELFDGFNRNSLSSTSLNIIADVASSDAIFGTGLDTDTFRRFTIGSSGNMDWGDGTASRNVTLRKGTTGAFLESVDTFQASFFLRVGNNAVGGTSGDIFAGQSGSSQFHYDQTSAILRLSNPSAVNSVNIDATTGGETVFNNASQDIDFRIETDGDANNFFVDAANNNTGFGTSTPDTTTKVHVVGVTGARAGTGTEVAKLGGTVFVGTTATGNVGVGEDDLQTYSLPASSLAVNGSYVWVRAAGTYAANVNLKQVKLYFGATVLVASGAVAFSGISWRCEAMIVRTGATTQKVIAQYQSSNVTQVTTYTTPAETLSGAVTIKITGEATANNDIVNELLVVQHYPEA